jgi:hypothetical protein
MAIDFVCGWECRIAVTGATPAPDARHWNTISGTPSISTTTVRTGTASLRTNTTAAAQYTSRTVARTIVAGRAYFRFASFPDATGAFILNVNTNGNSAIRCTSTGQLELDQGAAASVDFDSPISLNTWYRVDWLADCSTGTASIKARLNGGTEYSASNAQASVNITAVRFGPASAITTDIFFDDAILGDSAGEYPFGAGTVEGVKPDSDGTHSFTVGDFGYTAGGNVATSATDVSSYVDDDDLTSTSDLIQQKVANSTGYVEVNFASPSATHDAQALAVVSSWHASATGSNTVGLHLIDGATEAVVTDDAGDDLSDFSNTTITFDYKVYTTAPSGGAWTNAKLAALKARMGYATDVVGIPYWDGVMLEVAFGPVPAGATSFAQANARIKAIGVTSYAQAQAGIKNIATNFSNPYAQAQANIEATVYAHANAQTNIETTYYAHANAQANIKNIYYGFGQAQANIEQTYYVHAQARADIKNTYFGLGQAQAQIKQIYYAHAQAQARLKQTYPQGAQTILAMDTFTENGTGTIPLTSHTADIGGTYSLWLTDSANAVMEVDRATDYLLTTSSGGDHFKIYQLGTGTLSDGHLYWDHLNWDINEGVTGVIFRADANNAYMVTMSDGNLHIARWNSGAFTSINLNTSFFVDVGLQYSMRVEVTGSSPTRIRTKIWLRTSPEPVAWRQDLTDNTAANQMASGNFGVYGAADPAFPYYTEMDNFLVTTGDGIYGKTFASIQTRIKQTYYSYAQAQAKIQGSTVTAYAHAQAQANIKQTYYAHAQAQADIEQTYYGLGQAQANIKQVYWAHSQAQADIKQTYYGFSQSQANIETTYYVHANAQADIKQTYYGLAQAQAKMNAFNVNAFGQAQADIKQTYRAYAQAQADIEATIYAHGQAQADIEATYYVHANAQANIKNVYHGFANAQANIEQTYYQHAQAQANIETTYVAYAQAQARITQTMFAHSQAQANIEATIFAFAQGQADIKQVYTVFSQAQADIEQTYYVHAQAQTTIEQVYASFAQAQAQIYISQTLSPVVDITTNGWLGVVI